MKRSTILKYSLSAIALSVAGNALPEPARTAGVSGAAGDVQRDVIVILRDQLPDVAPAREDMEPRRAAIASAQAPLVARLLQAQARPIKSYSLINAFATKVSAAEAAQLAADPRVKAVVPDRVLHQSRTWRDAAAAAAGSGGGHAAPEATKAKTSKLCNTLEPQALQLTNAAFLDTATPQAQSLATGKGVTVAFIADGLDTTNPGFVHKNGKPVFVDYQDFSGDPAGTVTGGDEAFGDASSIAAQDDPKGTLLTFDISKFVNPAHPLPSPCDIRIRGIAPGASLVGLKVFSNSVTTTSNFIQAIDYAVTTDKVDVLNESFGSNPYPDDSNDPITLADEAAVTAGVTVVASTGDSGSNGTLGSPATSKSVIAAGASTQFRFYAQTGFFAAPLAKGFVSNNISALSSGGFANYTPRTVDVVAPGDLSWALCSTNTALYSDCTSFAGGYSSPTPSDIESFGGTSEAAPLTSGEAALVIQAYRKTHGGASPSPALVKQTIMSTATDLGAPASEQGAGLINALAAVQAAMSIQDSKGTPSPQGTGLLIGLPQGKGTPPADAAIFQDLPWTPETQKFVVTNAGSSLRVLSPSLGAFSRDVGGGTFSLQLSASSSQTFVDPEGENRAYITQTFTVPASAEHLDAAIAWPGGSSEPLTRLVLLDPVGKEAAYSLPQGTGQNYGHVDVVKPMPGTWTAVVFTAGTSAGYTGPVQLTWEAETFESIGSVSPGQIALEPGQSATVTASFDMPAESGDHGWELRFTPGSGDTGTHDPAVPVSLRSLVPLDTNGGVFSGTLRGGNGRSGAGPVQTFAFNVPEGQSSLNVAVEIPDIDYLLEGLLVDPNGMEVAVDINSDPFGDLQYGLSTSHYNPQPGLWKFVLLQDFYASGNQTSMPFSARVGLNSAQISATGQPTSSSTTISASGAGTPVTITVNNNGPTSAAFFADARLTTVAPQTLPLVEGSSALPGGYAAFVVPPEAGQVTFSASSSVPIEMDAFDVAGTEPVGFTGTPDILSSTTGTSITASLSEPELPFGLWESSPSEIGPYPSTGEPSATVSLSAQATIQSFDGSASSSSGDIWADQILGTSTYNPSILPSGTSDTITVTLKPTAAQGAAGTVVSGYIYVDTYNGYTGTGDEIVQIPYTYTAAP